MLWKNKTFEAIEFALQFNKLNLTATAAVLVRPLTFTAAQYQLSFVRDQSNVQNT
jgi:hypothetical protein